MDAKTQRKQRDEQPVEPLPPQQPSFKPEQKRQQRQRPHHAVIRQRQPPLPLKRCKHSAGHAAPGAGNAGEMQDGAGQTQKPSNQHVQGKRGDDQQLGAQGISLLAFRAG